MLSLKASRADNFYYGSVEDERGKKKKQQEEKKRNPRKYDEIKFEVPYTILCSECNNYIYKGERFQSERTKVGYYINTCFYSFLIYCKHCSNKIVFETNPKDCSYDIKGGAKQKNEVFENLLIEKGKKNISHFNFDDVKKRRINPFLLLEHRVLQTKETDRVVKKQKVFDVCEEGYSDDLDGEKELRKIKEEEEQNETKEKEEQKETKGEGHQEEQQEEQQEETQDKQIEVSSEEDMNEVIRETYNRNEKLYEDYSCNSNLRKQLRDIKKKKIQKIEENKKKNLFIDIAEDLNIDEEANVNKYIRLSEKYRKHVKMKKQFLKEKIKTKKSSIFDTPYLKGNAKKKYRK